MRVASGEADGEFGEPVCRIGGADLVHQVFLVGIADEAFVVCFAVMQQGGAPGEITLHPGLATQNDDFEILTRAWYHGREGRFAQFALEDPAAPGGRPANLLLPISGQDEALGRDLHAADILLRHHAAVREDEWSILPDAWKAAHRHIAVFVEDGVTQPMDAEGVDVPQSCDPNEMGGPEGVGPERKVKPGQWLTYTVYFENKPDATGAAQEVRVTHRLDPSLDWDTFELMDVAYRNQIEPGLAGKAAGVATSALAGTPYKVRTEAAFDPASGLAEWYLRIVDETPPDKWPADAYAGILPPNNAAHEGEGHVTYRVKVRDDAKDGARIDASATIVFDLNAPIETDPAWWNTVAHTIDAARFGSPAVEARGPDGVVSVIVQGGSADAATAVGLRVLGGSMCPSEDFALPIERLEWAKGDTTPKTLTLTFDPAALAHGDKTILLGLENADGLDLAAEGKTCAITIRRHIPTLEWPEGAEPSAELAAWVTEAATRALVADGPLALAPGTTVADLEQARALGVYPAFTPGPDGTGGATAAVRVALRVAALLPGAGTLHVTARVVAEVGTLAEPYAPTAAFALRGGATLDESAWAEVAPAAVGAPTRRSDAEADIPLRFDEPPAPNAFFRLFAR